MSDPLIIETIDIHWTTRVETTLPLPCRIQIDSLLRPTPALYHTVIKEGKTGTLITWSAPFPGGLPVLLWGSSNASPATK